MKPFSFLIILLIVIVGGAGIWWFNGTAPADTANTKEQAFSVAKGEGVHQIANNLKAKGLIKDATLFYFLIKEQHADNKIQAGEFQLSPAMSASKIAKVLQTATNDVRVTIPEGKRAEEVAEILQAHFSNYQPAWEDTLNRDEGYLFPDTYSFAKDADINTIATTMKTNFEKKYASIPNVQSSKLTKEQIVAIASMVEREAKFPEDRPLVASVIMNRIKANMPLDIDATIQYALGTSKNWWPTLQDSGSNVLPNSSYNSYTHNGLPPAPISNPGLDVLTAVVNAPQTDYIFYVSDHSGHNHYAKTLDEHNANIKKYGL
ncbi:MAG: endolytic transglycosylase MltG [Candidatus Levyibacteriota bacterium]